MKTASYHIIFFCFMLLTSCHPDLPCTSSITIDLENVRLPVNRELYGVSIDEINHAIDGGLYAEMVHNGSFEEGIPPLNCPYDRRTNRLSTPNGYTIPFVRPDSIPGWLPVSDGSFLATDMSERINENNRRALLVTVYADTLRGRGGAKALGYGGMVFRKGEQYRFSFYAKSASSYPRRIHVALEDSLLNPLSGRFSITPSYVWQKYSHVFTATGDSEQAVLTITSDSTQTFWIDAVSLMPVDTWKGRENGTRKDLAEAIAALHPRFIRFPGGDFVEGYTAGTYPVWHETVGAVENRRQFWNVWAYGSTNGMGYHEFLQFCEDMEAEPVYVVNSGVTSQSRRPRYEDITKMDKLVQDALDAIAYANEPADSTFGAMRAANGHPEPFGLKYIEIGSENYGYEYTRRFRFFERAIREHYPEVTIIGNGVISKRSRGDWTDLHFNAGYSFFLSNPQRYEPNMELLRKGSLFCGAFGFIGSPGSGTMRAALAEAAFLISVERNPESLRRIAYSPLLGDLRYTGEYVPAIGFNNSQVLLSPSYHMYKMFQENRGDFVLKSKTRTYSKPAITFGSIGMYMFDNIFETEQVKINGREVMSGRTVSGGWTVDEGRILAVPNRWNHILFGDSAAYDYTLTARFRRTKGSEAMEWQVRHNGRTDAGRDYIGFNIGRDGLCHLYHQSGDVQDSLATSQPFIIKNNQWYELRISCHGGRIECAIDNKTIFDTFMEPFPTLYSVATLDTLGNEIVLKVLNTTWHEEKTRLSIIGSRMEGSVEVRSLSALPDARNTFEHPDSVIPSGYIMKIPSSSECDYTFPPHSITVMRIKLPE